VTVARLAPAFPASCLYSLLGHHTADVVCPGHSPFSINRSDARPVDADPRHFLDGKYPHITENIMDTQNGLPTAERLEAHREIIRQSLDGIATEVESALKQSGLNFPVFVTVPNSGDAILTIASTLDPSDLEWASATTIVSQIIGDWLGGIGLRTKALPCAGVNVAMSAADVITD
jgi:hypothetical protein